MQFERKHKVVPAVKNTQSKQKSNISKAICPALQLYDNCEKALHLLINFI